MDINQAIVAATARLKPSSDTPALDAQVLLAHALGQDRTYLIAHLRDELSPDQQARFDDYIARRSAGTPVAYITGQQEFWSLPLTVTPDTLIPRPETELLVELALDRMSRHDPLTIADIGTGSGAIALAIASERPNWQVLATDVSAAALEVAKANATRLKIPNIEFREGENLRPLDDLQFDMIVSNPPYVPEDDPHLHAGDVRFEPRGALVAGMDGLDVIRSLVSGSKSNLKEGGWLLIEHGYDQEQAVYNLFIDAGYQNVECYRDLADVPRVTIGRF